MKPTILIIGSSFSSLREYLDESGYDYIVLKDILAAKKPETKHKKRVVCDFSSKDSVIKTVDSIKQKITGAICIYENYILPTSWIVEHLGIPGLPIKAAEACTDKYLMRSLFAQAPEKISPGFAEVDSWQDCKKFAAEHEFPLILKPANLAKSLLVTKNHDLAELERNYQKAMDVVGDIYKKYAPNRKPKMIIEEFLVGSIHSVDAFVDGKGQPEVLENIVDYQTGYDIGYEDNFHYSRILPSKLSEQDQTKLRHVASVGCKALGMKNSPAHVEIIMTKSGPRIVEIGARNGGYRERMHKIANGIDIPGAALATYTNQRLNITATKNEPCAVLELFPRHPGVFKGLRNEERVRRLESINYLSIKPEVGDVIGKSADGHKAAAVIMLHNKDPEVFAADLEFVNNNVAIETLS